MHKDRVPYFQHTWLAQKMLILFLICIQNMNIYQDITESTPDKLLMLYLLYFTTSTNPYKSSFQNSVFSLIKLNVPIFFSRTKKVQVKTKKEKRKFEKLYTHILLPSESLGPTWYAVKLI